MRAPGEIDLSRAERFLVEGATQWLAEFIEFYEENTKLALPRVTEVRASLPADPSFASYEEALAHLTGPRLPDDTAEQLEKAKEEVATLPKPTLPGADQSFPRQEKGQRPHV